ncbi:unnamed protein product, partial [marine sediment metagenome]
HTSNISEGLFVPIPTYPPDVIVILGTDKLELLLNINLSLSLSSTPIDHVAPLCTNLNKGSELAALLAPMSK